MITTNTDGNPISARWANAVKDPGLRLTVVDLYYGHQPLPVLEGLEVISGSITSDLSSQTRRSGSITLANTDLLTTDTSLSLEPYGLELGIRWGVRYPDGTEEFVRVGVFPFTVTTWNEGEGKIPTLTLSDRSYSVSTQSSRGGTEDYGGQKAVFAIGDLLDKSTFILAGTSTTPVDPLTVGNGEVWLIVDTATSNLDYKLPGGAPMQSNFWDDISALADSLNAQIYFSEDGVNVILKQKSILSKTATAFDFKVKTGAYGVMVDSARTLSRDGSWNGVFATGALAANAASTATPPSVFVFDGDPSSPTLYPGGSFGKIVNVVTNDKITSKAKLLDWANTVLAQGLGLARSSGITMLADARVEPGDVAQVTYLDESTELHMVQTCTLDLVAGTMSLSTIGQNQI